ncbi:aspartate kinase [Candidatus Parcubacteria bacterium]|nr:aspartate kinase [Candidatus Parcubacteria bacterium]
MNTKSQNKIIVNKFGGGILAPEYVLLMIKRIKEQMKKSYQPIIIVSAINGITDDLEKFLSILEKNKKLSKQNNSLIKKFIKKIRAKHIQIINSVKIDKKNQQIAITEINNLLKNLEIDFERKNKFNSLDIFQDKILSYGEKLSTIFFTEFLNSNNLPAKKYFAENIPIITDSNHLNANIDFKKSAKNINAKFKNIKSIPIIAGFTGISKNKNATTLGRGGTDTTACFIGAAMKTEKIILWKDVNGVLSADPQIVKNAKTIRFLSYLEAEEAGKIIHDKAMQYVKKTKTAVEVASISDYSRRTLISANGSKQKGAKIIGFKKGLTMMVVSGDGINEYGFLFEISKILNLLALNMVLIRNTRDSLQIVVDSRNGNLKKAIDAIKKKNCEIDASPVNMVTLIGNLDWKTANIFNDTLIKTCPNPQIGAFPYKDCVRLEAIVKTDEMEKVMQNFHKIFIE